MLTQFVNKHIVKICVRAIERAGGYCRAVRLTYCVWKEAFEWLTIDQRTCGNNGGKICEISNKSLSRDVLLQSVCLSLKPRGQPTDPPAVNIAVFQRL